ncbi:MAG: ComF family protein [Candidatus Accumulibacter sp.]|jgi:ComF family protein|nr:ComF family protein [Accumulibacter sp.]
MRPIKDSTCGLPPFPNAIERVWRRALALLANPLARLEQDCLLCASPAQREILCEACEAELPRLSEACCPRCALPSPEGRLCGRCLAKPPYFDAARAVFRYEFPLDKLVQSFKYGQRLALAGYFGRAMAALGPPGGEAARPAVDVLVPLPLYPVRLRKRGFNQSLELAKFVASAWKVPIDGEHCARVRDTPAQADLPWKERKANIRNAFDCSGGFLGKRVLIIDDVMTTGASVGECARSLKRAGAAWVGVLVLARALPKRLQAAP